MHREIQQVYTLADRQGTLGQLMDAICSVLGRHPDQLAGMTHSYRLLASDSGYATAFGLQDGVLERLDDLRPVEVTVIGKEADLLAVFQRKLPPLKALLLGRIKVKGNKTALLKLGEFL